MEDIGKKIVLWFRQYKRDLPWRETSDPYRIWVSEIILQQTQVVTGLPYYYRIIDKFPNVTAMAAANEDELLKLWQGLGYYSRARNMHTAAKQIVNLFGGSFPNNYQQLLSLKGIGEYTASAIASIAFHLPHAVVDGNVFRVLSRLFAIDTPIDSGPGKKSFNALAHQLLDITNAGEFNQAMMELGAIICKPSNPACYECPVQEYCEAFRLNTQQLYPVKSKKIVPTPRYLNYFFIQCQNLVAIKKRRNNDIWRHLYEFPLIESLEPLTDSAAIEVIQGYLKGQQNIELTSVKRFKHLLTHQQLHLCIVQVGLLQCDWLQIDDVLWIDIDALHQYTFPQPLHNYLKVKFELNS